MTSNRGDGRSGRYPPRPSSRPDQRPTVGRSGTENQSRGSARHDLIVTVRPPTGAGQGLIVNVIGDVDTASAATLETKLVASVADHPSVPVTVGLGQLSFLDSSGAAALLRALQTMSTAQGPVTICDADQPTRHALEFVLATDHPPDPAGRPPFVTFGEGRHR